MDIERLKVDFTYFSYWQQQITQCMLEGYSFQAYEVEPDALLSIFKNGAKVFLNNLINQQK